MALKKKYHQFLIVMFTKRFHQIFLHVDKSGHIFISQNEFATNTFRNPKLYTGKYALLMIKTINEYYKE